ncbi:UNVERIFIED_ORG: hypothetical protein B5F06_11165 [Lacrimispora saccharolytica]|nr:hypothetical protein CLOM621_07108 [Clostridium sp. M62/1]RHT55682.1 hypothetical protein DW757_13355 [Clostridium sp. AM29-11AC]
MSWHIQINGCLWGISLKYLSAVKAPLDGKGYGRTEKENRGRRLRGKMRKSVGGGEKMGRR